MKLSIITINYNDAQGLKRTLESVATQTYRDIEHIIVDGGSTDNSVDVIKEYAFTVNSLSVHSFNVSWSSEKDKGIYDGMNRGIRKATGEYIQILNSGDTLVAPDVLERIVLALANSQYPELLYGNCIDVHADGTKFSHGPTVEYSLEYLYKSTYPHETTFFRRDVFDKYGLFDENLRIVSDWKWFLQAIGVGNIKPIYVDIDVAYFDTSGVSSTHKKQDAEERRKVLEENIPPAVLSDLDNYAFPIEQYKRLRKHHLWGIVHLLERALLRMEKWGVIRR